MDRSDDMGREPAAGRVPRPVNETGNTSRRTDSRSGGPAPAAQPEPPASVREVMSQPSRYRPSPSARPASRARRHRPATPARVQPPLQTAREAAQGVPDKRLWREIEVDREKWTVRVTGTARVGTGVDAGPRVLHLTFKAPADRPNPARTLYVLARGIDEIPEEELAGLVADARSGPEETSGPGKGRGHKRSRMRSVRRGRPGTKPARS